MSVASVQTRGHSMLSSVSRKEEALMNAVVESKRAQLHDVCRRFHVHRLELFGSAVGQ
jgi:hypothetical protein